MPDKIWNAITWGERYNWAGQGEEWSRNWGNSDVQWFGAIYPRIHRFVHCDSILEIAPGYGRWSRFLIACSRNQYWGIDLSQSCIDACKSKFKSFPQARFAVNDGTSLSAVGDTQFDFIFSFDSLVHADKSVFEQYVPQILDRLSSEGVCFLHHSNLNELIQKGAFPKGTPLENRFYRDESMSGRILKTLVEQVGGRMLIQEQINWGVNNNNLIDCFSLFCRKDTLEEVTYREIINPAFMVEAENIKHHIFPYYF